MKLRIMRADPAGNITVFVLDPVAKEQRIPISRAIMDMPEFKAEQVGFACECASDADEIDGHMEMASGGLCGNATRAYGMYIARKKGIKGKASLKLSVSGAVKPVCVDVDTDAGSARSQMPLPLFAHKINDCTEGTLVHLGGIAHFVVKGIDPSVSFLEKVEPMLEEIANINAYGVMFLQKDGKTMTPLVKVPSAGSLVWEGSCGSGTLAAAVAASIDLPDGEYSFEFVQPAGNLKAEVKKSSGEITETYIGGPVSLGKIQTVDLDIPQA